HDPVARSRRTAAVQGQADDSGHQPTAQPPGPGLPRTRHPDRGHERWLGAQVARQVSHCRTHRPSPDCLPREDPLSLRRASPRGASRREAIGCVAAWRAGRGTRSRSREPTPALSEGRATPSPVAAGGLCWLTRLAACPGPHHHRHRRGHCRSPGRQDRGHQSVRHAQPPGQLFRRLSRGKQLRRRQHGKPLPPGTLIMSPKGNDLVRFYLWNAARTAIQHNPAIRALYRRLRAKGKRGDVAFGHCMRKLLHLVYAVWKTDRPFDKEHFPWEGSSDTQPSATTPPSADAGTTPSGNEEAVGHKRDLPAAEVVTTADATLEPASPAVKPASQ